MRLLEPLPGKIGGRRIFVLDLSRDGLRVAHQDSIGAPGERFRIEFTWDGHHVAVDATLTHSRMQRAAGVANTRSVYHSGFTIVAASRATDQELRAIIAWHVERALDEQKANARGIPAMAARSFQTGSGKEYIRHIYTAGAWHQTHTTEASQPPNGFTISAAESRDEVHMLRSAWEAGDGAARAIIQKMAELSISRAEGIPTRRYTP